jgi:hypothetical protein
VILAKAKASGATWGLRALGVDPKKLVRPDTSLCWTLAPAHPEKLLAGARQRPSGFSPPPVVFRSERLLVD